MNYGSPKVRYGEEQPLINGTHLQDGSSSTTIKESQGGSNVVATFFNFVKASIGSGSFALPFAVLSAGVLFGSAGMIILGVISVYTMQLMLECKEDIIRKLPPDERKSFTYTQLGKEALGFFGKWAVNISVLGCNLGVCAGYMIFIASNLRWAFTCFASHSHKVSGNYETSGICFTTYELYALILPILIFLTFLPSFKWLAYAAYVGFVFLAVAMITVFVYGTNHEFKAFHSEDCGFSLDCVPLQLTPPDWFGVAQWFGITAFLFCVHSMVIPLEIGMKHPRYMPYVLDTACLVVIAINLPFALYGYFLFSHDTAGYIFENIPGGIFNDIIRVFLSLELTLTFPIVFKPASDVMEEIIQNGLLYLAKKGKINFILELYAGRELTWKILHFVMMCCMKTLLVLVSWSVAVGIPRFELCLAFVGSLATSVLAFVLPPLFHLKLKWKRTSLVRRILHIVILVAGIAATIAATTINLYEAITNGSASVSCHKIHKQCH